MCQRLGLLAAGVPKRQGLNRRGRLGGERLGCRGTRGTKQVKLARCELHEQAFYRNSCVARTGTTRASAAEVRRVRGGLRRRPPGSTLPARAGRGFLNLEGARASLKACLSWVFEHAEGLRILLCTLAVLCSCTKAIIPEVPASRVLPSQSKARGVDLCVAVQEHFKRSGLAGVADPDGPDWHFAIASIIVKHPAGLTIIDPAFGRSIARDIARAGLLFSVITGSASTKRPLVEVLREDERAAEAEASP